MAKTYKHLFFDLDHTLWDFERNSEYTLRCVFDEYNIATVCNTPFEPFLTAYNIHNEKLWARFRKGFIKREELRWKRFWLTLLDFKVGNTELSHRMSTTYLDILPTQTILMPYAVEVLEHCRTKQYDIHMITNGFEATQWMKMKHSGIDSYFKEVITSEKSNSMKPHADIFAYALKTTGAVAEHSIMIGDALDIDILGAHNAGWDQVYYNPAKNTHDRKPTYEVHCLQELLQIL